MKHYIPSLDGWRAIAIGLVVAAHCYTMLMNGGGRLQVMAARFVSHAGYGVDVFFSLSGFLICTLLLKEKERTGTISLSRFYTRRIFRILPPMLVFLCTLAVLSHLQLIPAMDKIDFSATIGFFRNYIYGSWYTGHFWSLAVEEHFYAIAPIAFLLLPWRKALVACCAVALLAMGVRWYEFSFMTFTHNLPQFRTENRFDGLACGAILALLLFRPRLRAWFEEKLTSRVFYSLLVATAVALTAFQSQSLRRSVSAIMIPLLIAHTVLRPRAIPGRVLNSALLRWIGRLSYSLYIWQMLFLPEGVRTLGRLQDFPLSLLMPFVCAAASYYLIEKPMIRLGHHLAAVPEARRGYPSGRGVGDQAAESRGIVAFAAQEG